MHPLTHRHGTALRALLLCLCLPWVTGARGAPLQVLRGHVPAVVPALKALGALSGAQHLQLAISLPLRNEDRLKALLRDLSDPTSPRYRKYLSVAEFTAQYGPAQSDYDAVAAFAQAHGLNVTQRYGNRVVLDVDGAVSAIQKALHVTLRQYRHPREPRNFYAPDTEPALDIAVSIAHISGLDNYALPKPNLHVKSPLPSARARPLGGTGPSGEYIGNDFRAAYMPGVTLTGSNQVVGLLQFDGYSSSDIAYYETEAGLPNVPLTNVLQRHVSGQGSGTGGQLEVSLDIEMAVSMAPGLSNIIVYEGNDNTSWSSILNTIATANAARQISCSWSSAGMAAQSSLDSLFEEMAAQGQTFFCASGDSNADVGLIGFPEDSPYITQVGGTTLTVTGTAGAWSSETVWNWGSAVGITGTGSSGGISTQYSIPTWQQATSMRTNGGSATKRNMPDVALVADNVYVRAIGQDYDVGGTSCATPLWGALMALVNQQAALNGRSALGFINTSLYALADSSAYNSVLHDTTTGNNTSGVSPNAFYAEPGYDLCTGLGTPVGQALINDLALGVDGLQVSFASLNSTGPAGGAFSPVSAGVTLINGTTSSLNWSAAATQSWLTLSASGGSLALSGSASLTASINSSATALASGTYYDTISITDLGTGYVQYRPVSLIVIAIPVITSATAVTTGSGASFSYQITATNNPATYTASGLPSGLIVTATSGLISGIPTAVGASNIALKAIVTGGTGTATLVLTVLPQPPVITSATSATAILGQPFAYQVTATNAPTSFTFTNLPAGLVSSTSAGLISGTATTTGASSVGLVAGNAGGSGSATLILTVETPYQAWQASIFTSAQLANPAISGDLATPIGDGIPNLLKYALDLTPWIDGASGLPTGGALVTGSGTYLTLTYTQVISATDITYIPQVSTDTQTWNSGPTYITPVSAIPNAGGATQTITVQSANPITTGAQFMRLKVTRP